MACVNSKCCKEAESGEKPDAKLGKDVSGEQGNQQNFWQRFWGQGFKHTAGLFLWTFPEY